MKNFIVHDEWKIIEESYNPEFNKISESIFSLGNGRKGGRGNFEEKFTGPTLQGNYVAGVYYPDKTRVGWWKNGYPEYFAKVLNAANWIGINITIGKEELDLAEMNIESFRRELNMKDGTLKRTVVASFKNGMKVKISSLRFLSIVNPEIGAICYKISLLNFKSNMRFDTYVDFDIENEDSNYGEKFWDGVYSEVNLNEGYIIACTKKTNFHVCSGMKFNVSVNDKLYIPKIVNHKKEKYISSAFSIKANQNDEITIYKYGVNVSSEYFPKDQLLGESKIILNKAFEKGFDKMLEEHTAAWELKWESSDIKIEGDIAAQQ